MQREVLNSKEKNNQILDAWYESFKDYKVLSNKEAKKLLNQYVIEEDEEKKENLRNVIILGTMGDVYNFLKNSELISITSNYFDMEDIISSAVEAWINLINNPVIIFNSKDSSYAIDSKYVFNYTFYNRILSNLVGIKCKGLNRQTFLENKDFVSFYYFFLTENGKNITYDEYYNILLDHGYDENYLNTLPLKEVWEEFHIISEMINYDGDVTMENIENLKNYYYLSLRMLSIDKSNVETEDEIINRLFAKDVWNNIFESTYLTEKRKRLIYELFQNEENPFTLAKKNRISHQAVEYSRNKCFEVIRKRIINK